MQAALLCHLAFSCAPPSPLQAPSGCCEPTGSAVVVLVPCSEGMRNSCRH